MSEFLISAPQHPVARLILAHGAGAGMDSPFMQDMAERLCQQQIEVVRFNFPYMHTIAQTGKRRPPDRMPALESAYLRVIEYCQHNQPALPTFIGGKSMGGRVATLIGEQARVAGIVVMGYPFHPPGKPDKLRTEHLENMSVPLLILQGQRDTFGTQAEVNQYRLSDKVKVHFLPDGDHSLKPRKASGLSYNGHLQAAAEQAAAFMEQNR